MNFKGLFHKTKKIKKPDYKLYFVKVFGVVLLASIVLTGVCAGFIENYFNDYFGGSQIYETSNRLVDMLRYYDLDDMPEKEYDRFITGCSLINIAAGGPVTVELDGKEVFNSENSVIYYYSGDQGFKVFNIKIAPEEIDKCRKLADYNSKRDLTWILSFSKSYFYEFDINEVYSDPEDDANVYPARVNVIKNTMGTFNNDSEIVDTIDLTPTDKSYIDGKTLEKWESLDEYGIPIGKGRIWTVNAEIGMSESFDQSYETINGETHALRITYDISQRVFIHSILTKIYIINLVLVDLLASLLISLIMYLKAKSTYNIFEYRRKTTEAMAHDLKTPLAIASVYVDNLKETIDIDKDRSKYHAEQIEDSIKYVNKLINSILEYSNSQRDDITVTKEEIDVRKEIDEYISKTKATAEVRKLKIKVDGKNKRKTDKNIWNQSVQNVIDNAIKYASENSEITISISDVVVISNKVDADIADPMSLTEPFIKGDKNRGENSGSGLGLAIAKNNLESLGYKLTVDCENKVFTVTIK